MKNLLITLASFLLWAGADVKEKQAIEVVQNVKTDSLENVIATVSKKEIIEPCKEMPCDSNSYFNKGIAEGLKHCPVHKDKPCNCDPCPTHKLEVLEVGTVNKNTLWKVVSKCGTDCTEVVKIGVKKLDQK